MAEFIQVNVNLELDDAQALDEMAKEDGYDNRSAFVRRLIRQEKLRRIQQQRQANALAQAQNSLLGSRDADIESKA